jgi:hypothetical protein
VRVCVRGWVGGCVRACRHTGTDTGFAECSCQRCLRAALEVPAAHTARCTRAYARGTHSSAVMYASASALYVPEKVCLLSQFAPAIPCLLDARVPAAHLQVWLHDAQIPAATAGGERNGDSSMHEG